MIVASCPLRISLVGGSTDHPEFLRRYERGAVISFPSNLRTYITIHRDVFGINTIDENYNLNYSRRETVKNVSDIQNEMLRHCFEYLNVERINCSLVSDIYSAGSGLAASSAYLQALIKAIYVWRNESITEFEVCKIAEQIERKFNPLVGQQDFYKVIDRSKHGVVEIMAFNFNDDLSVTRTRFPDYVIGVDRLNGGQYSKTVRLSRGFTFNFRIHSASSRVEPSLKFDITAVSLPPAEVYQNHIRLTS